MPGPPIRTPSDHSPPAGSPRLIAGHHVLHRPLMPRHPPNAQKNKHTTQPKRTRPQSQHKEQRYSRPLYRSQPTRPHTPNQPPNKKGTSPTRRTTTRAHRPRTRQHAPHHPPPTIEQGGNQATDARARRDTPAARGRAPRARSRNNPTAPGPTTPPPPHTSKGGRQGGTPNHAQQNKELPRKEVIQPHLPVRLPCYDFVPITSPTFDRSP